MVDHANIPWGYRLDMLEQYGAKIPILHPLQSHCHALIVGGSGSGKSQSVLYLMKCLALGGVSLTITDFKNSGDYHFMVEGGYPHVFTGDDCYDGIMDFYRQFTEARVSGTSSNRPHLLILEEYPSLVGYLARRDKIDKTKRVQEVLSAIAEILMMGRTVGGGFYLWSVCQRPQAELFASGSRDSFMINLLLGRISKEMKGQLLSGEDLPPHRPYGAGRGILLADGHPPVEVAFPLIKDKADWQNHILEYLNR